MKGKWAGHWRQYGFLPSIIKGIPLAACCSALIVLSGVASAQTCALTYDLVMPPGLAPDDQYGYAMATSGDWLFVGAPMHDEIHADTGAVFVFRRVKSNWIFQQQLLPTGSVGAAHFGTSLAAEDDILIVGAEDDGASANPNAYGAAYVFAFNGTQWTQTQKLQAFGSGNVQQFGTAVAMRGDTAAVGARRVNNDGVNGHGAALIYRYDGVSWTGITRLVADIPAGNDAFGTALAMNDQNILVGCPSYSATAFQAGAVFVFGLEDGNWALVQKLETGAVQGNFGTSLSVDGSRCAVGAPWSNLPGAYAGAAFVYAFDGKQWLTDGPPLIASDAIANDRFGSTVSIHGDVICVGAPYCRADASPGNFPESWSWAGAAYIFRHVNGNWLQGQRVNLHQPVNSAGYAAYPCWQSAGPQPYPWPQSLENALFGTAVAVTNDCVLASTPIQVRPQCWSYAGPEDTGSVNAFSLTPAPIIDCNGNGINDECDPSHDCNGNYVPDSCDLIAGSSGDCNINSVPDECEEGARYQLDNGESSMTWFANSFLGYSGFIWLNQYRVKPGGQVITHISLPTTDHLPRGAPVTVMLYADPNQDGEPSDAMLLTSAATTSVSHGSTGYEKGLQFTHVPITPTNVGDPGTIYFVGAFVEPPLITYTNNYWSPTTTAYPLLPTIRSWWALARLCLTDGFVRRMYGCAL